MNRSLATSLDETSLSKRSSRNSKANDDNDHEVHLPALHSAERLSRGNDAKKEPEGGTVYHREPRNRSSTKGLLVSKISASDQPPHTGSYPSRRSRRFPPPCNRRLARGSTPTTVEDVDILLCSENSSNSSASLEKRSYRVHRKSSSRESKVSSCEDSASAISTSISIPSVPRNSLASRRQNRQAFRRAMSERGLLGSQSNRSNDHAYRRCVSLEEQSKEKSIIKQEQMPGGTRNQPKVRRSASKSTRMRRSQRAHRAKRDSLDILSTQINQAVVGQFVCSDDDNEEEPASNETEPPSQNEEETSVAMGNVSSHDKGGQKKTAKRTSTFFGWPRAA